MNCLRQVVERRADHAYGTHIQRLHGNWYFPVYGVEPAQINEWYLAVYADGL